MDAIIGKLEAPARVFELAPTLTLKNIGLARGKTFCDIGAGTGIFTFAARELVDQVFSLEMNDSLLDYMKQKAIKHDFNDISFVKTTSTSLELPAGSCDVALLCTVLHELTHARAVLEQIRNILKPGGMLGLIEFHKAKTPFGPPVEHRISESESASLVENAGFRLSRATRLGDNYYLQAYACV